MPIWNVLPNRLGGKSLRRTAERCPTSLQPAEIATGEMDAKAQSADYYLPRGDEVAVAGEARGRGGDAVGRKLAPDVRA